MLFPVPYLTGALSPPPLSWGAELTHGLAGSKPDASNRLGTHEEAVTGLAAIWRWQTDPLRPPSHLTEATEIPGQLMDGVSTLLISAFSVGEI